MASATREVAGRLRHRVSIVQSDGTVLGTVWASVQPLPSAREWETPTPPSHDVAMRFPGFRVTPAMHLTYAGRTFDILSVTDVDELHAQVQIVAAERLDGSTRTVVTFTRRSQAYNEDTGRTTVTETTIVGTGVEVPGSPERYAALGLILSTMPTLLFRPTATGLRANTADFVQPGDGLTWAGKAYTVKDVDATAPDGFVLEARIVIAA